MEELKNISDSGKLLDYYAEKLGLLGVEFGFENDAKKAEEILRKKFEKSSDRFKEESESRQILRKSISILDQKTWKRSTRDLIAEFRSRQKKAVLTTVNSKPIKAEEPKASNSSKKTEPEKNDIEQEESKKQKANQHIEKLNRRLRMIEKKITELEEDSEWSDCDDDANSPYILVDKYKRKAIQIHKKIKELLEESAKVCRSVEDPINLPEVTEFPGMARKIQKFVNKSTDLPDIQDYTDLIKAYSEKNNSKITSKQIEAFSKKYVRIVTDLWRRRRLKDFQEDLFLVEHEVPDDAELIQKLKQNDKDQKSIESVLEEFTVKQEKIETGEIKLNKEDTKDQDKEDELENQEDIKLERIATDFEVENIESEYSSSDSEDELEETTPLDEENGILAEEVAANSEETQDINLNEKENIEEVDQKKRNLKISESDDTPLKKRKLETTPKKETPKKDPKQPTLKSFMNKKLLEKKNSPTKPAKKLIDDDVIVLSD